MKDTKSIIRTIRRMYSFTSEHFWKWGILRLVGGFAMASANLLYAKTLGGLIDVVYENEYALLMRFILMLSIITVGAGVLTYVNAITAGRYSALSEIKYRNAVMKKLNKLPMSYYDRTHSGKIMSKLTSDINGFKDMFSNTISGIWSFIPALFIVGLVMLLTLNWKLTIISLVIVPPVTFLFNKLLIPVAGKSKELQESKGEMNVYLRDYLEGFEVFKMLAMKLSLVNRFNSVCERVKENSFKMQNRKFLLNILTISSHLLPWVISYAVGGIFVSRGEMSIGQLFTFANVMIPFMGTFYKISAQWTEMVSAAGKATNFFDLMDEKPERMGGGDFSKESCGDRLSFYEVSFSYAGEKKILSDCTFRIKNGRKTALVGASGTGKTTVQKLLCGFYENYSGGIFINGHELREWNPEYLRGCMSYINQDVFLFSDTVKENIRLGKPSASDEEIKEAAEKAYAHDFIEELPEGYDTVVGERGVRLSEGQRQRIAIARAVLKDSPIILMDEPTSALDVKAEFYVKQALDNLGQNKTVLIIAHRNSTIEDSDEIIVLDDGRIIASGSHDDLKATCRRYRELYDLAVHEGGSDD